MILQTIKKVIHFLKNNIQTNQILLLSTILIIWVEFYWLNTNYIKISVIFSTLMILDALFLRVKTGKWTFPFSWVAAWFGISLFLRTDELLIYFFVCVLAIVWKNLFTIRGRHFMNPSNMAIFTALILFPYYTWINTLQWGNHTWVISEQYLIILLIALFFWLFITYRVYQIFKYKYIIDYIWPFLILHLLLFFFFAQWETLNSAIGFFSVSFFIFVFHMITDPKTVPNKSFSRFFYSISIVLTFYILQFFINESYALLGSLFFNTLTLPIIWLLEEKKNIYKKLRPEILFLLTNIFIMVVFLSVLTQKYGRPDLAFDNVCQQLICK